VYIRNNFGGCRKIFSHVFWQKETTQPGLFISEISHYWKSHDYDGTNPQLEKVENMPNIFLA
jgi:hypothetical protein